MVGGVGGVGGAGEASVRAVFGVVPFLAIVAIAAVAACARPADHTGGGDSLTVADAYAAEPLSREVGAVYLTIVNPGSLPDTLVGASTPVAAMAHLHRMSGAGMAQMRTQDVAVVPAGGQLQLKPGGLHLMLMDLTSQPRAGDTIDVTLQLRRAGAITVRVPVVSYLEVGERAAVGEPARAR
jgi:copper(I)-binding protein